ncbi:MAG: diaminopimelate decarboxylase [Candidatus Staskawiczbacteria bacterium]|nr:diaminopimelate decarboxylase [Candidatus Staskawiczbacteria bacterium]
MPSYWRKDVYPRLPAIIDRFGSPFHFLSLPGIAGTAQEVISAFGSKSMSYRQFQCIKALPEPWILGFLFRKFGFGFDCSSPGELALAWSLGAKENDIVYSSNDTATGEFEYALSGRGSMLNLDDISFIPLVPVFPKKIFFRINPGKRLTTPKGNVIGDPPIAKYGITIQQIIPAYKMARDRGAREFGIHIMVCSNDRRAHDFVETARFTLEVAVLLYKKLGIRVSWIDIGGGFGIPYRPKDPSLNLDWIATRIDKLFRDFAGQFGFMPMLMTESGRYITGPHGIGVNRVIHVMQKYRHFIGVQAAMSMCPRPAFYGAYHYHDVLTPDGNLRFGPRHFTNVVDPMCENWGRLTAISTTSKCPECGHTEHTNGERLLPRSVQRGDIHVTYNCGAHSGAMAPDSYNFRLPIMGLLDQDGTNENVIMIRKPKKAANVFSLMVFPPGTRRPHPRGY